MCMFTFERDKDENGSTVDVVVHSGDITGDINPFPADD